MRLLRGAHISCLLAIGLIGLLYGCRPTVRPVPSPATRPVQPVHRIVAPTVQPVTQPTPKPVEAPVAALLARSGDEIMVCGQLYHIGAPVVLWADPGGYDAYRTERRFSPWETADYESTAKELPKDFTQPNRYGPRKSQVDDETFERVRGGGWDLPTLQGVVDQFVFHYDDTGTSRQCFNVLQDHRCLSVHFMIDLDGTIYQTLDLKERAWHATISNSRSIGVEIANVGAYPPDDKEGTLDQWYHKDPDGRTRIVLPAFLAKNSGIRTPDFTARPIRNEAVIGQIQDQSYRMYDLTPQQYQSLIRLTASICTLFPKINCDGPRDQNGKIVDHILTPQELERYQGLIGHFHIQKEKIDPGPAFQWDRVIDGAQGLMSEEAKRANHDALGHPAMAAATAPTSGPATLPATTSAAATTSAPVTQAVTLPATAPATVPSTLPATMPATTESVVK